MSHEDFLENDAAGQDFSYALDSYMAACREEREDSLLLTEEEYIYIIEYFIDKEDEQEALKASKIAFSQHSYSLELLIKLADSMIITGDSDDALVLLDTYRDSYSENADILYLYCRAYIHKRNFDAARGYFEEISNSDGSLNNFADATLAIAQDCIDAANYQEALYYLEKASESDPSLYECFNDMAYCHEKLDNLKLAEELYNKYLDKDPFNDNVWFNLGTIFARQSNFEKATEAFEYSLALNEKNSSSLYNMAVVCLNLEQYKKSADFFASFLECEPDSIAGYIGLANAKMGLGDYSGAREAFSKANSMDPTCGEVNMGLEAVSAIEHYIKGDRYSFFTRLNFIAGVDRSWIETIMKLLPEISKDQEFMNFIKMTGI